MINANADAMGIIFPNNYDKFSSGTGQRKTNGFHSICKPLSNDRFLLSSMVGCGIDKIEVLVRENYHSLVDHLGGGREWDLSRKNGGLSIFLHLPRSLSAVWEEEEWKRSPIFFRYSKAKRKICDYGRYEYCCKF